MSSLYLPLWVLQCVNELVSEVQAVPGKGAQNMATTAFTFVTFTSGLNRLPATESVPQQACQLWQGKADVYTGLIGLGKEDGLSGHDAAPAPLPTSHKTHLDVAESSWGPASERPEPRCGRRPRVTPKCYPVWEPISPQCYGHNGSAGHSRSTHFIKHQWQVRLCTRNTYE